MNNNNESYYIFSPPYSDKEYFVKVKEVRTSDKDQNEYVYYDYLLSDMDGSCEVTHFEEGSTPLNENRIENIIENIKDEIEDLRSKKQDFIRVLEIIQEEKGKDLVNENNLETNSNSENIKERDIERVN